MKFHRRKRPTVSYESMSTQELVYACTYKNEAPALEEFIRRFHKSLPGWATEPLAGGVRALLIAGAELKAFAPAKNSGKCGEPKLFC
jgi:hypothetical protein